MSNIEVDDFILTHLLEFPPEAFEIVVDAKTNKKSIQIKKPYKGLRTKILILIFNKDVFENLFVLERLLNKNLKPKKSEINIEETRKKFFS